MRRPQARAARLDVITKIPMLQSDIVMRSYEEKVLNWEAIRELAEESPIVADAVELTERFGIPREQALMVAVVKLALKNDELAETVRETGNFASSVVGPSLYGEASLPVGEKLATQDDLDRLFGAISVEISTDLDGP